LNARNNQSTGQFLHFVFITGVSKFSKVSVFSAMNNLVDISMNYHYATPTFLIELIKKRRFNLSKMSNFEVDESVFMSFEPEKMTPEPVLWQTGYLTITGFKEGLYQLGFPNFEVEYAFHRAIVAQLSDN
jgi:hypothetical protein